jgi:hypothetical protein
MIRLAAITASAITAAVTGWCGQQVATVLDSAVGPIERNCLGAGIFAAVLFVCLVAIRLPAREWR